MFRVPTYLADITDCGSISSGMQPAVKGLDQLVSCTKFSREELQQMYRGFKNVSFIFIFVFLHFYSYLIVNCCSVGWVEQRRNQERVH